MKKSYLLYALLATTALGVTSCKDDMDGFSTSMDNSIQVNAMIGGSVNSKAAPTWSETTTAGLNSFSMYAWQEGVTDPVMNATYSKVEGTTSTYDKTGDPTYWPDGTVKFWAYAVNNDAVSSGLPTLAKKNATPNDTLKTSYTIAGSANDDPVLAYTAQAKHQDDNYVNLTFQHLLSRVTVNAYAPGYTAGYVRILSFGFTDVELMGDFSYVCPSTGGTTTAFNRSCWKDSEEDGAKGGVGASASTDDTPTAWYTAGSGTTTTWSEFNGPVAPQTQESTTEPLKYEKKGDDGTTTATVQLPWLNVIPSNNVAKKLVLTYEYYCTKEGSVGWQEKVATLDITALSVPTATGAAPASATEEQYNPGYQYVYNVRIGGHDTDDASVTEASITLEEVTVAEWKSQEISEVTAEGVSNGAELKSQIEGAQAYSTITLNHNVTLSDPITISKPLTIDLGGYTITAGSTGVVFNITTAAADVTIKNGKLEGTVKTNSSPAKSVRSKGLASKSGTATSGVVNVTEGANLALDAVDVTSGSASLSGIYVAGAATQVSLVNGSSVTADYGEAVTLGTDAVASNITADANSSIPTTVTTAAELTSALALNNEITLGADITADVVIPATFNGTIDLNGKKLTNVSSNTITVSKGATLTINGNNGTVDNKTHGKAAIYNKGTLTLEGGTYDRSAETGVDKNTSGGNSFYTILNHGTMTVANVTVNNKGHFSSLFENGYYDWKSQDGIENPTLTITSGTFDGGLNTIKNDDNAQLTINGGTFKNYTQACFQNHNVATVTGGNFTADGATYAVINCGCDATHDLGTLNISGGTFVGTIYNKVGAANAKPSITGGTFNTNISDFVATGYTATKDETAGTWTVAASSSDAKRYIRRR